jgi:hypothetical protein
MRANTINICLGHRCFPEEASSFYDLHIAPYEILGAHDVRLVPDALYGIYGSALSEYAQLIWLFDNSSILTNFDFVRIVQYRRFVSSREGGIPLPSAPWSKGIRESEILLWAEDFSRYSSSELLNTAVRYPCGVFKAYCGAHLMSDFLAFSVFLLSQKLIDESELPIFFYDEAFIPACNTGLFSSRFFLQTLGKIKLAANFIYSHLFNERTGYQRRSCGFLLERFNSFLIMKAIRAGERQPSFGFNKIITETDSILPTVNI